MILSALAEKQYSPRKVADGARAKAEAALTEALAAGSLGVAYVFLVGWYGLGSCLTTVVMVTLRFSQPTCTRIEVGGEC